MARRKRKQPVEQVEEPTPRRRRRRAAATTPSLPIKRHKVRDGLRPVWRIAADMSHAAVAAGKAWPFEKRTHDLHQHWRELFCISNVNDEHNQWGENGEVIRKWDGFDVVTEFVAGTKSIRIKRYAQLRDELAMHIPSEM